MSMEWLGTGIASWGIAVAAWLLRRTGPSPYEGWPFRSTPPASLRAARSYLAVVALLFGLVCIVFAFVA